MQEWVKIGASVLGAALVVWTMLQQHEYRLGKLEDGFETHLDKHEEQYRDIQKSLREIDLTLTRMAVVPPNGR